MPHGRRSHGQGHAQLIYRVSLIAEVIDSDIRDQERDGGPHGCQQWRLVHEYCGGREPSTGNLYPYSLSAILYRCV